MTTTSTTYRREVTESAGVSGGTFPTRQLTPTWPGMASTTTSTSTSVRAPPSRARSRSSSWWPGARTVPRSRRRCCTPHHLMLSRSVWLECRSIYRSVIIQKYCSNHVDMSQLLCRHLAKILLSFKESFFGGKIILWNIFLIKSNLQATDESEASEEAVEEQLRKTDRVWFNVGTVKHVWFIQTCLIQDFKY